MVFGFERICGYLVRRNRPRIQYSIAGLFGRFGMRRLQPVAKRSRLPYRVL